MKTTQYILDALKAEGADHAFFVPGGLIDAFLATLSSTEGVAPIVAAHEGGAACMADGYAKASGRFGACFAIGGPGVTNMVTAAASARADSSPILIISGQVPTDWEGKGGFQDSSSAALNDIAILSPVALASLAIENIHLVHHHLRECFTRMLAGHQGPVHVSVPIDIQHSEVSAPWVPLDESVHHPRFADREGIERLWKTLLPADGTPAKRVAILAGAGVEKSEATDLLIDFAEQFEIPVATTLRAKGVFPENHRLSLGVFGYAGHRPAIDMLLSNAPGAEVEVLLVLGSGLSQRDTMYWDTDMLPSRAMVHVDVDPTVLGRTWQSEAPVVGDCGEVLKRLLNADSGRRADLAASNSERAAWVESVISAGPRHYDLENTDSDAMPLHPARVVKELRKALPRAGVLVSDSGAHRAFCCHYWESYGPRSYFSAANIGPMGWAIPAAVGVQAALPEKRVATVTGDGCMLMHGVEMQTAARYNMPIVYIVVNNAALGNVWLRASQQGPGPEGLTLLPRHDWAGFAKSLGLEAESVERPEDLAPAMERAFASGKTYCLDVWCDRAFKTPVTPYAKAKQSWVDED